MAKEITNDELAALIQGEFNNIHDEFRKIRNEFGGEFDKIRNEFGGEFGKVNKQLFELASDMTDVKRSLQNTEKKQEVLEERVNYHHDKIKELDGRVKMVESAVV